MMIWLATPALIVAAALASADDVRSRPLLLHSPTPAARAMKYALLPDLMDTTPGNAADHYRRAIQNWREGGPPEFQAPFEAREPWFQAPLKDLRLDELARLLKQCESAFREAEAGARCEQCEWGMTKELRQKGFSVREPDVQALLEIDQALALRCRYELAQGRTQDAIRTLRTGFAMSRHVADTPAFFIATYGMFIGGTMLQELDEVVQQPDAPSFYWPLTDLPRPLFDLRKMMQGERVAMYGAFPGAAEMASNLNAKPWTPEQAEKTTDILLRLSRGQNQLLRVVDSAKMLLRIAARHEAAKKELLDEGRPKELVDAMPHVQVALLVALREWDRAFDESVKCESLPYPEMQAAWSRAEARQQEMVDDPNGPAIPLGRLFTHNMRYLFEISAQEDRRVAALRCVEAVRLYAAVHDGKLPASLDEIKDTPIPFDPVDGKPFGYRLVGDRAFLTSTPIPGQPAANANTPTYELISK
jgi:hypothetical protein